ncbi:MAG: ATP-binding protein [Oscillospiraceae bacterium]
MNNEISDSIIDKYFDIYAGSSEYCAVLDSDFTVLKSSDERLFAKGECMAEHFCGKVYVPLSKLTSVRIYKRDKIYCGRLHPAENLIICELFTSADIIRLSEITDMASRILPMYSITEMNIAALWDSLEKLRCGIEQSGDCAKQAIITDMEARLTGISSISRNIYEYYNMCFSEPTLFRIDAGALCRHLVDRCNAALTKCGRHVELLIEPGYLQIRADSHRATAALVNALQNALLYSPRESVPIMTVYAVEDDGRRSVEISVINDNIMFTRDDFSSGTDFDYNYQRAGYGIPIIKRFAESCRGKLTITDENGKKRVKLTFPYAPEGSGAEIRLENSECSDYKTGIPDLLDIKTREVLEFFGGLTDKC